MAKWVELEPEFKLKTPDGKLDPSVIDVKRIPGFSTNMIPGSKKVDLFIRFNDEHKDTYGTSWKVGEDGLIPTKETYTVISTRERYYIPVLRIHGHKDKYTNSAKPEEIFEFEVKIKHCPLLSNYWHFEFSVITIEGEISGKLKGYKKTICSSIRDRIQQIAVFKL